MRPVYHLSQVYNKSRLFFYLVKDLFLVFYYIMVSLVNLGGKKGFIQLILIEGSGFNNISCQIFCMTKYLALIQFNPMSNNFFLDHRRLLLIISKTDAGVN